MFKLPIFELFLSVGNLKWKLKWFFKCILLHFKWFFQAQNVLMNYDPVNCDFTSSPSTMPKIAPKLQNTTECHSSLIFIQKMVKAAAVIPHD